METQGDVMETMKNELAPMQEKELGAEVTLIEQRAQELVIRTDEDFVMAGNAVKMVKSAQKRVEEYWEPMRKTTYDAYKSVTDHKKSMVDPLKKAEKVIKGKMGDYQKEKERRQREQDELLRRAALEEMQKKLAEASLAEKNGDLFTADYANAEAEALRAAAENAQTARPVIRQEGLSLKRGWAITSIDLAKLPDTFAGILLRPADEKAIMQLIRESKGGITIPGVEFMETVNFAVKA